MVFLGHDANFPLEPSTLASYNTAGSNVGSVVAVPPASELGVSGEDSRFLNSGQQQQNQHLQQNSFQHNLQHFSGILGNAAYAASSATSSSMTATGNYPVTGSNSGGPGVPRGSPLRGSLRAAGQGGQGQHSVTISNTVQTSIIQSQPSVPLSTESSLETIAAAMASTDSGLDVRDRMWLKIRIPSAFIGSDVVHWLYSAVAGLGDRKDAKKVASKLLKEGLIRHTINLKNSFSEKCYYVFSETVLHKVALAEQQQNDSSGGVSGLEEGFANGLRLTNENFQQQSVDAQLAALTQQAQLQQQQQGQPGHWSGLPTPEMMNMMGGGNSAAKQNSALYPTMPFMRYWDETSEIQNYGLIGPTSEEGVGGGILDSLHHSSGMF